MLLNTEFRIACVHDAVETVYNLLCATEYLNLRQIVAELTILGVKWLGYGTDTFDFWLGVACKLLLGRDDEFISAWQNQWLITRK